MPPQFSEGSGGLDHPDKSFYFHLLSFDWKLRSAGSAPKVLTIWRMCLIGIVAWGVLSHAFDVRVERKGKSFGMPVNENGCTFAKSW
ncbi:MAG TPA: hypothetical protein VN875_03455 [Candidatus Binatus sp.]|nr:hypothetical protein [Candidatus Binatus sp.]